MLHVDDGKEGQHYIVVNTFCLLDDFSPENGATRLVPSSHKWEIYPDDLMENPLDPHLDEVVITAPAGSVMIFNGHLWHGRTEQSGRGGRFQHTTVQENIKVRFRFKKK